ncbi:MAG: hypothetical protein RL885_16570 [Planctomycetota bacterium]
MPAPRTRATASLLTVLASTGLVLAIASALPRPLKQDAAQAEKPGNPPEWPRRTTLEELGELWNQGKGHTIRIDKIAHAIRVPCEVESRGPGHTLLVSAPDGQKFRVYGIAELERFTSGTKLEVEGLILDEAYAVVWIWAMKVSWPEK